MKSIDGTTRTLRAHGISATIDAHTRYSFFCLSVCLCRWLTYLLILILDLIICLLACLGLAKQSRWLLTT